MTDPDDDYHVDCCYCCAYHVGKSFYSVDRQVRPVETSRDFVSTDQIDPDDQFDTFDPHYYCDYCDVSHSVDRTDCMTALVIVVL